MTLIFALVLALITPPVRLESKSPPTPSTVQMDRSNTEMIVNVSFPGGMVPMMLDTGASICMCPINWIQKYNIPVVTTFHGVAIQGVAGSSKAILAYMVSMTIGSQTQTLVPIAVTPPDSFNMCLLGRSYLDHYAVTVDGTSLTLHPR